ncbi:hypothetical protein [Streptomyces sp. LS1784]|uniref:hypothetical protein n=1 Tax=Streptomyces sp. LS1784 TaxID=2851533 RepID=UPI001CCAE1A7|nr:hypothetical protein [Streptomyces sp. LS1784]
MGHVGWTYTVGQSEPGPLLKDGALDCSRVSADELDLDDLFPSLSSVQREPPTASLRNADFRSAECSMGNQVDERVIVGLDPIGAAGLACAGARVLDAVQKWA